MKKKHFSAILVVVITLVGWLFHETRPCLAQVPDADDGASSINEQTIYVPYDKLRDVFERDGRGVFLPYDKFQQLWNEARKNQPKPERIGAPLGALITDIESTAILGQQIVKVDATLKIELLRKGWHRIPLRLDGAAISGATIGGDEALLTSTPNGQYELLVSHDSDDSKTIELKLSYAKTLSKTGGQSTVAFRAPQAPVNRWTIRTGQKDIDVQIEPMIASTRKTESDGNESDTNDNEESGDEILAFVGAAPEVKILWTPKSEGASGLAALVSASTESRFRVDQGVARTSATVTLDVTRAEINTVSIRVPSDQKVVSVFDRNVKKWDVTTKDDQQVIAVELFEPTLGRQVLVIELEKFIEDIEGSSLRVPQIKADGVSRNSGIVVVGLSDGLRAEPATRTGLVQLDKTELQGNLKGQPWEFAYRYASLPFDLSLNVKKIQPLVNVDQLIELTIRPEKVEWSMSVVYNVQLAGVFQVDLDIPNEFEIREIRPLTRKGLASIPVDTFYRDPENENRVLVTLNRKALGDFGLFVSLERELSDPNLLGPTGVASKMGWDVPKASIKSVEFSKGNLVVYAPESLQVNAADTKGLRNESFKNAYARHVATIDTSAVRPILAFDFSHTDAAIELQAKRRKPQVTVEQVVVASVKSGVVEYDARLFYEVLYSGVKSVRLDVPTDLVGDLRIRSNAIHYQTMEPQPDDVADGYTAWTLTGDNEFFGKHEIRFTWQRPIEDLPLGESIDLSVDRLVPTNVDLANGQIVFTKSETIDVQAKSDSTGLRPIDPQTDLAQGQIVENAAMAFEFVDDWTLNVLATRFELQELKRTSISRAVIRAVALRQNELSVQCLYQMRSVGQRISIQMPTGFDAASSFDDQPVRVNGRGVTPERGGQDLIYVPLTGVNSDEPFLLELRYTIPGDHQQIDLPLFTDEPAVQKVYLCVYLPFEDALIHHAGNWTDESISGASTLIARIFRPRTENVDEYLRWVTEGVTGQRAVQQKFEVDGHPYVFSALRPLPAPTGSLRLKTMSMLLLNTIVCGVMGLIGLLLIRARLTTQLAGVILVASALVLTGLFLPLVPEHLFSESLLLTTAIIGLAWGGVHVMRLAKETRLARQQMRERAALEENTRSTTANNSSSSPNTTQSDGRQENASPSNAAPPEPSNPEGPKSGDSSSANDRSSQEGDSQ